MMLEWENIKGFCLSEIAVKNGFTYIKWVGLDTNTYNLEIYDVEASYHEIKQQRLEPVLQTRSGDRNRGPDIMIQRANDHAKKYKHRYLIRWLKRLSS